MMTKKFIDNQQYHHKIKDTSLFCVCSDDEIRSLLASAQSFSFEKNAVVFLKDSKATYFYFLVEGAIKLYKSSLNGKEIIIHTVKPGAIFAEAAIFGNRNYPVNAETTRRSVILGFQRELVVDIIRRNPEFAIHLLDDFANRIKTFSETIEQQAFLDVRSRLGGLFQCWICERGIRNGSNIVIAKDISIKEIAERVGTVREVASRMLKKFQNEGLISIEGNSIKILNPEYFRKREQSTAQ
jgi:CRP-like cAMP-binding protein